MSRDRIRRPAACLCAVVLFLSPAATLLPAVAQSDGAQAARQAVERIVDRATAILEQSSGADREAAFLALFRSEFATTAIGRFVLGPYRANAGPALFRRYLAALEKLVAKTTAARLSGYSGESVSVGRARSAGRRWIVDSRIAPRDREPVRLDWVLVSSGDRLKVVDLRVENLSLALAQREEFASVLQANGGDIDQLIGFIDDKIRDLDRGGQ